MNSKQVIVFRKDLNVRKGKFAAQVAHASLKVFLDMCEKTSNENNIIHTFSYQKNSEWDDWINGRFTKIVLSCDSEEELLELFLKAKNKKLPCALITDAGKTEFNGVPTRTCIAIGPAYPADVDEITKHLKLL